MNPEKNRHTRGTLNIIESIVNTLFDTATQSQINFIHNRLHSLDSLAKQERKTLNVHSSILNVTVRVPKNVHRALDRLKIATRITEENVNIMNKRNKTRLSDVGNSHIYSWLSVLYLRII